MQVVYDDDSAAAAAAAEPMSLSLMSASLSAVSDDVAASTGATVAAVRRPRPAQCSHLCVTTETRHLDRLGQLGEFEQDSNTASEQESNTDSHSAGNKAHVARQSAAVFTFVCVAIEARHLDRVGLLVELGSSMIV